MTILLFGVSNVGKTTAGKLLAERLNYDFYDLDEEVKKQLNITLEQFVSTGTLYERDHIRSQLIHSLVSAKGYKVIAVTPLSYIQNIRPLLLSPSVLAIELSDSAENIFGRLVFSDENDIVYKDDDYKNKYRNHYISEIKEDLKWYGSVYRDIKHHFHMIYSVSLLSQKFSGISTHPLWCVYVYRIAAFCGVSFFLAINKTSKLSNYILHQFRGLHNLWDTPHCKETAFDKVPIHI